MLLTLKRPRPTGLLLMRQVLRTHDMHAQGGKLHPHDVGQRSKAALDAQYAALSGRSTYEETEATFTIRPEPCSASMQRLSGTLQMMQGAASSAAP